MDALPGWEHASAVILSCPGPLRRHNAALMPMADVVLPQVLLGSESQLLAFAAAATGLGGRLFFAPLPEMFPDRASLCAALGRAGHRLDSGDGDTDDDAGQEDTGQPVHLRFGSIRAARVLKGIRNACVVAETIGATPLTASHHPFASGLVLPAAIRRLFVYGPDSARAQTIGGVPIRAARLPADCVQADLRSGLPAISGNGAAGDEGGLDLVSLAEFRSFAWAAGPVKARGARALLAGGGTRPAVLMPWNMDHPGSVVPDLLERLARLHDTSKPAGSAASVPSIVLLPFNYVGQTGIIRRLITRLREAAHDPDAFLSSMFLARIGNLQAVAPLRRISGVAWVDGNDPEHWWTLARLAACGIDPILIDPLPGDQGRDASSPGDAPAPQATARVHADEAVWVEAETRCGALTFAARLPSFRALPTLLALTASRGTPPPPGSRRAARARKTGIAGADAPPLSP